MTFPLRKNPEIGDIHFVYDDREVVIIERKSLSDLIASIKDRRYEEQSHRLIHTSVYIGIISCTLLKGSLHMYAMYRNVKKKWSIPPWLHYNCIRDLALYEHTLMETAEHVFYSALKLNKELSLQRLPWTPETKEEEPVNYCRFVSKVKRENIKQENIGEIMLTQIPGISSKTAVAIMKEFENFPTLIDQLRTNPQCLDTIVCITNGKTRKLGKNVKEGLLHYLT